MCYFFREITLYNFGKKIFKQINPRVFKGGSEVLISLFKMNITLLVYNIFKRHCYTFLIDKLINSRRLNVYGGLLFWNKL